jgi:hypothetical protein
MWVEIPVNLSNLLLFTGLPLLDLTALSEQIKEA